MPDLKFLVFALPVLFVIAWLYIIYSIVGPWRRSFMSGGKASLIEIMMTTIRKNPVNLIVDAYLSLLHSGVETTYANAERHFIVYRPKIITSSDLVLSVKEDSLEA